MQWITAFEVEADNGATIEVTVTTSTPDDVGESAAEAWIVDELRKFFNSVHYNELILNAS